MSDLRTHLISLSEDEREAFLDEFCQKKAGDGQVKTLLSLLSNFGYLDIRTSFSGVQKAIEDYGHLANSEIVSHPDYDKDIVSALLLIQQALQQSAHIIEQDSTQLPGQLLARLIPFNNPTLNSLLNGAMTDKGYKKGIKDYDLYPWLEPLTVSISHHNEPLQRTITTNLAGSADAIAISLDGMWLLAAKDKKVEVRSINSGELKNTFETINFWEYDDQELSEIERSTHITALALSIDGQWGAIGLEVYARKKNKSLVEVWNLDHGVRYIRFESSENGEIISLAISQNGRCLIVGYSDGGFNVWAINQDFSRFKGAELNDLYLRHSTGENNECAISPNGKWGVTASSQYLFLWDFEKGFLKRSIYISSIPEVKSLALTPEGKLTVVFANCKIKVWDLHLPNRLENISIWRGVEQIRLLHRKLTYPEIANRTALQILSSFLRDCDASLWVMAWGSTTASRRRLISKIIFFIQKPLLAIIARFDPYINQDIEAHRVRRSDMANLWHSVRTLSYQKAEELTSINIGNLTPPESISANGIKGLSRTKTEDIQIVNLVLARTNSDKTRNELLKDVSHSTIYEPWGRAVALSMDGRWAFSLVNNRILQKWDITGKYSPSFLSQKNIPSCWQRIKNTWELLKETMRTGESPYSLCTMFYHRDIFVGKIDLVAKSLNGRWFFLFSKNNFDVRDLAKDGSESSLSHWLLRDVSSNGRWALWQSSAGTLRLTNLKTGKIFESLQDYYGNLADPGRWRLPPKYNKNDWKREDWKYQIQKSNATNISSNGKTVLIFDNTCFESWIWYPSPYLKEWDTWSNEIYEALPSCQTLQSNRSSKQESAREKWMFSSTAFILLAGGKKTLFGLNNGELKLCNLSTDKEIFSVVGHKMAVTDVSLSQNEEWAVSCSLDQTLKIWKLSSFSLVASFTIDCPFYLCKIFSSEGELFVTACDEFKRTHVFNFRLPENYDFASETGIVEKTQELKTEEAPLKRKSQLVLLADVNKLSPIDFLQVQQYWQSRQGLPLPLHLLKDLSVELNSEVGVDYTVLKNLLEKKDWDIANDETSKLILKVINSKNQPDETLSQKLRSFPCADLLTIDRLWLKYSHGKFGFSLQMRIWEHFKNNNGLSLFNRAIARKICDVAIPCENVRERRGHYPYPSFMWDQPWKSLFIRLAECTGYENITDDVDVAALEKELYSHRMISTLKSFIPVVLEETEYEEEPLDQYLIKLRYFLKNREWGEACKKTFIRLLAIKPSAYFIEIQAIDNLWVEYSNYHFGFSVQKRIWEGVGRDFSHFCNRVGWWSSREDIEFSISSPEGHLPTITFHRPGQFEGYLELLESIFMYLETIRPDTIPYRFRLRGLSDRFAYLNLMMRGSGFFNIRLYLNDKFIAEEGERIEENEFSDFIRIPIRLPSMGDDLRGRILFKPDQAKFNPIFFATFTIDHSIGFGPSGDILKNVNDLSELKELINEDKNYYRILELQKQFLGPCHQDVVFTLEKLVQQCEASNATSEAEFFKHQIQEIEQSRQQIEIGDEFGAIVLLLNPDEIVSTGVTDLIILFKDIILAHGFKYHCHQFRFLMLRYVMNLFSSLISD